MSRLILVFLAMTLIVSFMHGERFVTFKITPVFVSKLMYDVKLFRNEHVPRVTGIS